MKHVFKSKNNVALNSKKQQITMSELIISCGHIKEG